MKTLVIGANGQLGTDIVKVFSLDRSYQVISLTRKDIDVTRTENISDTLAKYQPDMLISTAAYHRVDECENHITESFAVNAFAVQNLAQACREKNVTMVHFSTDYVFGQDSKRNIPYNENDLPGPLNIYGISKLTGEYFLQSTLDKFFLIRTCGLYGTAGPQSKQENFVDSVVKKTKLEIPFPVVNDQIITPTSSFNLAQNLSKLLQTTNYGLYHMTSQGQCSWYEFAKEIAGQIGRPMSVIPISTSDFKTFAKRPAYSVLENQNLKLIKMDMMKPWKDSLNVYLKAKKYIT